MIASKFELGVLGLVTGAIALGLVWQMRDGAQLRAAAAQQSAAAAAGLAALEKQVATHAQRATQAEAKVAALLKAAQLASAARPAAPAAVDTADALKAVMARAARLIDDDKPKEALDEYVKAYREFQALRPGSGECQSLMSAIQRLGRNYPAALVALGGLRDAAMTQRKAEPGRRELVSEIALLNQRLGEGSRTMDLYDTLPVDDIDRRGLAMIARPAFIEARRYNDALVGKSVGQMLNQIESAARAIGTMDAERQAGMRQSIVDNVLTDIEVLTGAGKLDEARLLTERLLAFDGTESTRARLRQHIQQAQASKP